MAVQLCNKTYISCGVNAVNCSTSFICNMHMYQGIMRVRVSMDAGIGSSVPYVLERLNLAISGVLAMIFLACIPAIAVLFWPAMCLYYHTRSRGRGGEAGYARMMAASTQRTSSKAAAGSSDQKATNAELELCCLNNHI